MTCSWCHNPESQSIQPQLIFLENRCLRCGRCVELCQQKAVTLNEAVHTETDRCSVCGECESFCWSDARQVSGKWMTVDDIITEIERDAAFYQQSCGGITLSGGEPLMQAEFAIEVLRTCRNREWHTAFDTCGHADWSLVDQVREVTDLFLYDLKLMDDTEHRYYTGVSNALVINNLRKLCELNENLVIRFPVIPTITDTETNLNALASFVRTLPNTPLLHVLPFHPLAIEKYRRLDKPYLLENVTSTPERLEEVQFLLSRHDLNVSIGG